ncbi:hypothetical protein TeGR_g14113 [Tetraparma gracilis]|jgi:hypothetical protein|uniref:PH domain-containing protein n=1 Tax=Tetraparma gracilis TaxID=2962635 RepID=A0ABQ6NB63_9STRA|nr:hypothetical protein TeGR_g14113 [Tetraparma gracilis]
MAEKLTDDDAGLQLSADQVASRASVTSKTTKFTDLHGYLKKKSRHDRWQKRWFEANDHYLTYYKSPQSEKLLACIDLYQTGVIQLATEDDSNTADESHTEFSLELGDRFYIIKAETRGDAKRWVEGLTERKKPKSPANKKKAASGTPNKNEGRFTSFMASPDGSNSSNTAVKEAIDAVREAQEEVAAESGVGVGDVQVTATVVKSNRDTVDVTEAPKACCTIS